MNKPHRKKKLTPADRALVALSLPTVLWYICFCFLPMFGIIIAFKQYRMAPGKGFLYSLFVESQWVGFKNFRFLFLNPQMTQIIRNTVLYNLFFLALGLILHPALAIALSYLRSDRLRSVTQTASMLPHFLSWIVVSYFAYAFLSTDKGVLNGLRELLGLAPIKWYQEPDVWPLILTLIHEWKTLGYSLILYYSYVIAIDPQLYDSAALDGASVFQMIFHITLPQLRGVLITMGLLNLGAIFTSEFGLFYQVTRNSGAILSVTQTVDVYIYKALMEQSNFSFSAAGSLLQNGLGCILLLAANAVVRRIDPEAGL